MIFCICEYQDNKKMNHTILLIITTLAYSGLALWIQPEKNGSWYFISQSESLTFFEAEEKCLSRNGHLAKVNGTLKYDEDIVSTFGRNDEYWIGLSVYQREESGNWTATSNGSRSGDFGWIDCSADNKPDLSEANKMCVSYKDTDNSYYYTTYEIVKQNCYDRNNYVCESQEQNCDEVEVTGFSIYPAVNTVYRKYNGTCDCCDGVRETYINDESGWFMYYDKDNAKWHISQTLCKEGYYGYVKIYITSSAFHPHHINEGSFWAYEYYNLRAWSAKFTCLKYNNNVTDHCNTYETTTIDITTQVTSDYSFNPDSNDNGNWTSYTSDSEEEIDLIMFYLLIAIVILIVIFTIVFIVLLVIYRRLLHKSKANNVKDDQVTKGDEDEADLYSYADAKHSVHGENLSDVYAEVQ